MRPWAARSVPPAPRRAPSPHRGLRGRLPAGYAGAMERGGDETETVALDGADVPVRFRPDRRARRISLRVDARAGGITVTLPPGASRRAGRAFLDAQTDWVRDRLAALGAAVPFAPDAQLQLHGETVTLTHAPAARRGVWREDGRLLVSGDADHFARRTRDWLRGEARRVLTETVAAKAARLTEHAPAARPPGRITVRDTRSRWGSCAASGGLSFSWRLLLAPPDVLDYVVAHEMAHLAEMNHGPRFWALCAALADAADGIEGPRAWLRDEGSRLHRYG